jgi:hypothetical protein
MKQYIVQLAHGDALPIACDIISINQSGVLFFINGTEKEGNVILALAHHAWSRCVPMPPPNQDEAVRPPPRKPKPVAKSRARA